MHEDIFFTKNVKKPKGDIFIVYFSSSTGNTARFVGKTGYPNARIPIDLDNKIKLSQDYVIVCPTYSGGGEFTKGSVPKQVIKFLNNKQNRDHCKGVIATGNTNFNNTFCLAGPVLSKKLNVPLLYQLELSGTKKDVERTKQVLEKFWGKEL